MIWVHLTLKIWQSVSIFVNISLLDKPQLISFTCIIWQNYFIFSHVRIRVPFLLDFCELKLQILVDKGLDSAYFLLFFPATLILVLSVLIISCHKSFLFLCVQMKTSYINLFFYVMNDLFHPGSSWICTLYC